MLGHILIRKFISSGVDKASAGPTAWGGELPNIHNIEFAVVYVGVGSVPLKK
jgi:hypothetical protein